MSNEIKTYKQYLEVLDEKLKEVSLLSESSSKNDKARAKIFAYLDLIFLNLPESEKEKSENYVYFKKQKAKKDE